MSYLYRFWTGDYMVWGSISLVAGFPQKRKFFGNFNCDFRKFHQRVFSDCMNIKNSEILVLTENSVETGNKLFDVLVKPILPYGCETWGPELLWKRHIFIKVQLNKFRLILQTNIECSMVHRTENTACRAELGRYHLSIDIKASLLCYWQRLEQKSDTTAISTVRTFIKLWIFFTEIIS